MIPNILATRYASQQMTEIWSARNKVIAERQLWLAVLRAQADLGVEVPDGVVDAYRAGITASTPPAVPFKAPRSFMFRPLSHPRFERSHR